MSFGKRHLQAEQKRRGKNRFPFVGGLFEPQFHKNLPCRNKFEMMGKKPLFKFNENINRLENEGTNARDNDKLNKKEKVKIDFVL